MTTRISIEPTAAHALKLMARRNRNDSVQELAGKIINDWLVRQKTDVARELIIEKTTHHQMTQFVTIPFVRSGSLDERAETAYRTIKAAETQQAPVQVPILILRQDDRPLGDRMVKRYFSTLRRSFDKNLAAIAISETVKKNGFDSTFLHYHCLIAIPERHEQEFRHASQMFWGKLGVQKLGFPVKPSIERLSSPEMAIRYALKNVDDRYPIQNIILSGYDTS